MARLFPRAARSGGRFWRTLCSALGIMVVLSSTVSAMPPSGETVSSAKDRKPFAQLMMSVESLEFSRGTGTPNEQVPITVTFMITNPTGRTVSIQRSSFISQITDSTGQSHVQTALAGLQGDEFIIRASGTVRGAAQFRIARTRLDLLRTWSVEWKDPDIRRRQGFASFTLPAIPPLSSPLPPSGPAPSPAPELPPAPPAQGDGASGRVDASTFQRVGNWSAKAFYVRYGADRNQNVSVYVVMKNPGLSAMTLRAADVVALIDRRDGTRMPAQIRMEDGQAFRDRSVQPGEEVRVTFTASGVPVISQRLVHMLTLMDAQRRTTAQFPLPQLNLDGTVGAQTAPPAQEANAAAEASLKGVEGTFRTNQGTLLTLTVDGRTVTGRAVNATGAPNQREQMTLTLQPDGTLKGTWREERGPDTRYVDVTILFQPDNRSFSGPATIRFASYDPPFTYSGTRVDTSQPPASAGAGSNVGFKEAGYMALRLDAVMRGSETNAPVEVAFTAKNYQGGRQSLQHNDNLFFLVGSDGREYKSDGNFYGRSRTDVLTTTVWVEGNDQAEVTYVFPGVPANVTPTRVVVRDRTGTVGDFALAGAPTSRSASTVGDSATSGVAGQPVKLENFEVTLVSMNRGADRDWESVVVVQNTSEAARTLLVTDITYVLYGADGQAREADGEFYQAAAGDRRRDPSSWRLPPGGTARFRLWHRQSADLTPARFRVRERRGEAATAAITTDFLNGLATPPASPAPGAPPPPPAAPPSGPAGPSTRTDGNPIGTEIRLGDFNATLLKIERGPDRSWRSTVIIRNATTRPRRLADGDVTASLYAGNGVVARGIAYYVPGNRPNQDKNPTLLPSETVTVVFTHFDSASLTPAHYQLHEPARSISRGGPVTP